MSILVAGTALRICRVASRPLSSGMAMSMTTTAGAQLPGQLHRLAAVLRLADDLDVAFGLQQRPKPLADDRVVIGQQHGDRLHVPDSTPNLAALSGGRGALSMGQDPARPARVPGQPVVGEYPIASDRGGG